MASITIYTTKDASAFEQGNSWSGWDDHHPVGTNTNNNTWRSFMYFPISFTGWTAINSAVLWFRGHKQSGISHVYSTETRSIYVERVISDWGEGANHGENSWSGSETWNWTNRAGARSSGNQATRSFSGGVAEGTWYSIDVTGIVRDWFSGSFPNYGFQLRATSEANGDIGVEFYARDRGVGYKPNLVIDYSTNTVPNAPTSLNPTANALVNTLTPNLSGAHSDPDAGDLLTAYQILFFDDAVNLIWDSGALDPGSPSPTFSKTYSGPPLSGNVFYRWEARTRDTGGAWGPYSALNRFKTNTPPNPPFISIVESPASDIRTLTPTINITHSDNDVGDTLMYGYHVTLETSDGALIWDSGDVDTSGSPVAIMSFAYSGPGLAWRTGYRFRARTKDVNGIWGNYSSNYAFNTHSTANPVNLDPPSGGIISGLVPTFYAERGDTNDTLVSYQINLYAYDNVTLIWDSGTLTTGLTGSTFSKIYNGTALSYGATYFWTVRVTGSIGGTSDYVARTIFSTPSDASVPTQNIPTPNTAGIVTSLTPTFSGGRSTSAFTNYQIQLFPSTATSGTPGTPIWDSGNLTQASATTFSKLYNGPALAWNTTYKWRVAVGAPALGGFTGMAIFTTDAAGVAILTAPADNAWLTTLTPTLSGTTSSSELATSFRILLYEANGVTLHWDSGDINQTAGGTFSTVYNGPALVGGLNYQWKARYTKNTGPTGSYSAVRSFHTNAAPSIPTQLSPTPGMILNGALTPVFTAFFNDPDKATFADFPTAWVIEIRKNSDDSLVQTKTISTNLISGLNTYVWGSNIGGADSGLAYATDYKWKTWFVDSKGATGAQSSYQVFHAGQPPVGTIITPSNGSNIATTRPTVTWSFTGLNGKTQIAYLVTVVRVSNGLLVYNSGVVISSATQFTIPAGFINQNDEYYSIGLYVYDTDNLQSNGSSVTVQLQVNAPPRIEGLSVTIYEEQSRLTLDWDPSALAGSFITYVIYRRRRGDTEWTMIGAKRPESNVTFNDWYAGQQQLYEYRVTVVKLVAGAPDLESPDSDIAQGRLESDVWFVVGGDRSDPHIFELPVSDESHTRPVQTEVFEPLGVNRKAVVRGFVLGHEGTLHCNYMPEETQAAKAQIEYLEFFSGPHILKTPFGDVYDVTFTGPDYKYTNGGMLEVDLSWIEIGATNNPGLTPDQFLLTIGAE